MSKKEMVARGLQNRLIEQMWSASRARRRGLRILAYHRVLDDDIATFDFDEEVISATSENFAQQMQFVRRHFDVVSFADLHECEKAARPWPERALIITFDDGYRDNYTHAFPILRENNLPATIFLATDFIGEARLFWWDLVAYCIKKTGLQSVTFTQIDAEPIPLGNRIEKRVAIEAVLDWIKRVPEAEKNQFLAELPQTLEVTLPDISGEKMHLSWQEVKSMAAQGIEFGSHTHTHPILANVEAAQLDHETAQSRRLIEEKLGKEIVAFSYPVGGAAHFNAASQQSVARHGFRFATSYLEGVARENESERYALPRIHVEVDHSLQLFRANLMFPNLMLR